MGQGTVRHHEIGLLHLPLIIGASLGMITPGKLSRLRKRPSQILIPVLLVSFPFGLLVAGPLAGNLPTVGNIFFGSDPGNLLNLK